MSIDTRSAPWAAHQEDIALPGALIGGTKAMRAAGTKYLPKGEAESDEGYDYRLGQTFVYDAYRRTLNFLVGQVFSKNIQLADDVDRVFADWADRSVDGAGSNLSVFGEKAFRAGVHSGVDWILAEYPRVKKQSGVNGDEYLNPKTGSWEPITQEALKQNGWAPYLVLIESKHVIDAWEEVVDGKPRLAHLRYYEAAKKKKNEFETEDIQRIRVLRPGSWELWENKAADGKKKASWDRIDHGTTGLDYIPGVRFAPGEPGERLTATPALNGLAELCQMHWQASSGHRNLMDWARRPLLFGKCITSDTDSVIPAGPGQFLHAMDPAADLRAVAVAEAGSVTASREDLRDIEGQMSLYGLRLLAPNSGRTTATEVARDASESDCVLKKWAQLFRDKLEEVLAIVAKWLDVPSPSIGVNVDYSLVLSDVDAQTLLAAEVQGILPKAMVFDEFRRRGLIPDSASWAEAKAMIEEQLRSQPVAGSAQALASQLLGGDGQAV